MAKSFIWAIDENGNPSKCTAKPENRGKGKCNHKFHASPGVSKIDAIKEYYLSKAKDNEKEIEEAKAELFGHKTDEPEVTEEVAENEETQEVKDDTKLKINLKPENEEETDEQKELRRKSKLKRPKNRQDVAENPNCPSDVLDELSKDENDDVRAAVALNPNTSQDALNQLAEDSCTTVRGYCAHNPNTSSDALKKIWNKEKQSYFTFVTGGKSDINHGLCTNPNTSPDVLDEMVVKGKGTDSRIIDHPNVSDNTLKRLVNNGGKYNTHEEDIEKAKEALRKRGITEIENVKYPSEWKSFFNNNDQKSPKEAVATLKEKASEIEKNLSLYTPSEIGNMAKAVNWKSSDHYDTNSELSAVYADLYRVVDGYAIDNLKDDALTEYLNITD